MRVHQHQRLAGLQGESKTSQSVCRMQAMMALVLVFACAVLGLHMYITRRFPAIPAAPLPEDGPAGEESLNGAEPSPEPWRLAAAPGQVWPALLVLFSQQMQTRHELLHLVASQRHRYSACMA